MFFLQQTGEFRCTAKAIYKITEEGIRVARWTNSGSARESPHASTTNLTERSSVDDKDKSSEAKIHRRISLAEKMNVQDSKHAKESNTERLRFIIDQPQLRQLFRDFLRDNFCEENLSFWVEVEDFKRKFNITSSASSALQPPPVRPAGAKSTPGQVAMEQHHEALIQQAFEIYRTYLAPSSPSELNIDHGLRNELSAYLSDVMQSLTGAPFQGRLEAEQLSSFNATQLQMMIKLYERIQMHVFRLMATDSVPKVCSLPLVLVKQHTDGSCSSRKRRNSLSCGRITRITTSSIATCTTCPTPDPLSRLGSHQTLKKSAALTSPSASRRLTRATGTKHINSRPCRGGIAGRAVCCRPDYPPAFWCSCRCSPGFLVAVHLVALVLCPSLSPREVPCRLLFSRTFAAPFRCPVRAPGSSSLGHVPFSLSSPASLPTHRPHSTQCTPSHTCHIQPIQQSQEISCFTVSNPAFDRIQRMYYL